MEVVIQTWPPIYFVVFLFFLILKEKKNGKESGDINFVAHIFSILYFYYFYFLFPKINYGHIFWAWVYFIFKEESLSFLFTITRY